MCGTSFCQGSQGSPEGELSQAYKMTQSKSLD